LTALIAFFALFIIDIPIVRELAVVAIVGIALKFVSNLIMLPLLASSLHYDDDSILRLAHQITERNQPLLRLAAVVKAKSALLLFAACAVIMIVAGWQARGRAIGDMKLGAPELSSS